MVELRRIADDEDEEEEEEDYNPRPPKYTKPDDNCFDMEMYHENRRDEISHCAHQWWWYDRDCLADWTKECDKTYGRWDDEFNKDYEIFSHKEEEKSQSLLELPSRKKDIVPPPEQCYGS